MTFKLQTGTDDSQANFPSFLFFFFKMSQYPIPNQHRMSQECTALLLHSSPKITFQLCTISLVPSLHCSITPQHSLADSPQDTCFLCGGIRQVQGEATVVASDVGVRCVLALTWDPSLFRAGIFPCDKTCTATGVTTVSHWAVFIGKYPDTSLY